MQNLGYRLKYSHETNYAKVHGSVSVDTLQRKEAFKSTKTYFQEKLLSNFFVKMKITDLLGLILEMPMHNFVEIFLE